MQYQGRLYGKIGREYFDTGKTSEDWDALEKQARGWRERCRLAEAVIADAEAERPPSADALEWRRRRESGQYAPIEEGGEA